MLTITRCVLNAALAVAHVAAGAYLAARRRDAYSWGGSAWTGV